jgi:arginine-tRNA-protein transferase
MQSLVTFTTPPHACSYLPVESAVMRYDLMAELSAEEYQVKLLEGWRRFGHSLFRPECPNCVKCISLRIPVDDFQPDRSQRRAWAANHGEVRLQIGEPSVTREKLELYDRFHAAQTERVGWPSHAPKDAAEYIEAFVSNPFESEEWCYFLGEKLVGVGYVDRLPLGLSAIYFFHDPEERKRSLGTFNVLSTIERARELTLPHVYLGYYVESCRSLDYKTRFRPNEALESDGAWRPHKA